MASTSETRVYSALFSTTLDDHRPELVDQVHSAIPLLWYMKNKGRGRNRGSGRGIRLQNGGARIKIPVIHAKNANTKSYSKFENLDVNATDEITIGIEDMRQLATTVGISGEEMDQNQGIAAKRDLLRDKIDIAEIGLTEEIERQLMQGEVGTTGANPTFRHVAGNNNKDLNPLGYLIQKEFSNLDGVHSIDQNAETWWRNQTKLATAGSPITIANLRKDLFNLYNTCSKGSTNDAPDLVISNQELFEYYEAQLSDQQRYGNYGDEAAASAGFETMSLKGALWFWSDFMPGMGATLGDAVDLTSTAAESCAFFINTRWLELVVSARVNMVSTPFVEPYDQDAIWSKILFRGQMTLKQRRKFGVYVGADVA